MLVRETCNFVVNRSKNVKINSDKLKQAVTQWVVDKTYKYIPYSEYECHFVGEQLIDYLFILDSLNFCFWPLEDYEYDNLANQLKLALQKDKNAFQPQNIIQFSFERFTELFPPNFPLLDERFRLFKNAGQVVMEYFDGRFTEVIIRAQKSAVKLLQILTTYFVGFQDHAIYEGHQIFFYKRAQILIGDIYASLNGKGLGEFHDIDQLTMFPDYRVPQILAELQVMQYSQELTEKINQKQVIPHGSEFEIEIRAATVIAVEQIKEEFKKQGIELISIEVDWILWQIGEAQKKTIMNHHRVLSIYY